jgi:hypothetical protein
MAADNNIAFERLELLDQLADKQEEIRSKPIAVTCQTSHVYSYPEASTR